MERFDPHNLHAATRKGPAADQTEALTRHNSLVVLGGALRVEMYAQMDPKLDRRSAEMWARLRSEMHACSTPRTPTPSTMPAEVITSADRWRASAASTGERSRFLGSNEIVVQKGDADDAFVALSIADDATMACATANVRSGVAVRIHH